MFISLLVNLRVPRSWIFLHQSNITYLLHVYFLLRHIYIVNSDTITSYNIYSAGDHLPAVSVSLFDLYLEINPDRFELLLLITKFHLVFLILGLKGGLIHHILL